MRFTRKLAYSVCTFLLLSVTAQAAIEIAVFGDNAVDNFIDTSMAGYNATLVSNAQLATAGFLDAFDAFFMTRDGASFGSGLSAAAAANVSAYVGATGNIALLNGDFADGVPGSAFETGLIRNAIEFAAASGSGFIGEFNGTVSALTSNSNGFTPIGLIDGAAGSLNFGNGGSSGTIVLTPAGVGHEVTDGLAFPNNPPSVEYGATISGVDSALVLAVYSGGSAAIIARNGSDPGVVPEASSLFTFVGLALCGAGAWWKTKKKAS